MCSANWMFEVLGTIKKSNEEYECEYDRDVKREKFNINLLYTNIQCMRDKKKIEKKRRSRFWFDGEARVSVKLNWRIEQRAREYQKNTQQTKKTNKQTKITNWNIFGGNNKTSNNKQNWIQ